MSTFIRTFGIFPLILCFFAALPGRSGPLERRLPPFTGGCPRFPPSPRCSGGGGGGGSCELTAGEQKGTRWR